jgi:hypothetical protein
MMHHASAAVQVGSWHCRETKRGFKACAIEFNDNGLQRTRARSGKEDLHIHHASIKME